MPEGRLFELFSQTRYNEVLLLCEEESIVPATHPKSALVLGASHYQLGNFRDSLSILSELEATHTEDLEFLALYGVVLRRLGDLHKAKKIFQHALSLDRDSLTIRNNYANLLIDLKEFDLARTILDDVLRLNPDYADAIVNRNRLTYQVKLSSSPLKDLDDGSSHKSSDRSESALDPLLMAFDDLEVSEHGRLKNDKFVFQHKLPDPDLRNAALDKVKLAEQSVAEGNSNFALELCSQALAQLGPEPSIYDCASDAYIQLNQFQNAEITLMHAAVIHGITVKHCINLVTLCCMRGDLLLADYYLEKAFSLDPSHPNLNSSRNLIKSKRAKNTASFSFQDKWETKNIKLASRIS